MSTNAVACNAYCFQASSLPLSIIIVGVGNTDFTGGSLVLRTVR